MESMKNFMLTQKLSRRGASLFSALVVLSALGSGCAHNAVEKSVDQKLTTEEPKNRAALAEEAKRSIETAPGLTDEQRKKLTELRASVRTELDSLAGQSAKLRSLLIQDVLASQENPDEVKVVKKRLKSVENKRLAVIFDAVDKANSILGREARANAGLFDDFTGAHDGFGNQ
jgi:ABC-type branched-subunit amino acid transport system ATPase component